MKEDFIQIKSISHLHDLFGIEKPKHPLVTLINVSELEILEEHLHVKTTSDLYTIALKDKSCGLQYGRNSYDFDEGVMYFASPNQVQTVTQTQKKGDVQGWMLFFHPDLIRNSSLGTSIDSYKFFSYDVHEALHLSDGEQETITNCVNMIEAEINERIDNHSNTVICSSLELLLNLSKRFYERQFNTRSAKNTDVVSQFQGFLKEYYREGNLSLKGHPSIEYFSERVHLSPNYLSDLLKKETGLSAKDHINSFIIDKAKTLLLQETESISEIAYTLGFNYPHYFSRLFKKQTGTTPVEYRQLN